jgi:hypothetical protein
MRREVPDTVQMLRLGSGRALRMLPVLIVVLGVVSSSAGAGAQSEEPAPRAAREHVQAGSDEFQITTLSSRNDMVSGGDTLLRIDVAPRIALNRVIVALNGTDRTATFDPMPGEHALLGLLDGLQDGNNYVVVEEAGRTPIAQTVLALTNYPVAGPVFSGPHEQPFACHSGFRLANGERLAPAQGPHCSVDTRVDYVYRSAEGTMKPLRDFDDYPSDLMFTTTMEGWTVPYIVRVETGTINRAIYETAMLHDPISEPEPSFWNRTTGWNGRLVYRFGGGCRSGWYFQGNATGGVLDDQMLLRGYATASATLNVYGNNCSDLLAAETMMMVKERFIESYGPPRFTIGWGSSGGSYQSHQISDNYPGLLDGIVIGRTFPDVTIATNAGLADARLLETYFTNTAPDLFTKEQQRLVAGYGQWGEIAELSEGAKRLDPVAEFAPAIPEPLLYNARTNPRGARATVYDHTVNAYGRDERGFARRPLDNVGIQYGLGALNAGHISLGQFLDLNERIGGLDVDLNPIAQRMVADPQATRLAYATGRILDAGAGLASTPIVDYRNYLDDRPQGDIHQRFHSFSTRERLIRANGHADNQVMLVAPGTMGFGFGAPFSSTENNPIAYGALDQMDLWLVNLEADTSTLPRAAKVVRTKPADLVDACFTAQGERIVERQTFDAPGRCNQLYPAFPPPRVVAGGPLTNDVVKCSLKPVDAADYRVPLSAADLDRLRGIFPTGVCDWSKPGMWEAPLRGTWLTFGGAFDLD